MFAEFKLILQVLTQGVVASVATLLIAPVAAPAVVLFSLLRAASIAFNKFGLAFSFYIATGIALGFIGGFPGVVAAIVADLVNGLIINPTFA